MSRFNRNEASTKDETYVTVLNETAKRTQKLNHCQWLQQHLFSVKIVQLEEHPPLAPASETSTPRFPQVASSPQSTPSRSHIRNVVYEPEQGIRSVASHPNGGTI